MPKSRKWIDDSDPQKALAEVMSDNSKPSLADRIAGTPRKHDNDNPLWCGPCGDGPLGGITQSMLVRFLSCRERFRLKYVLGLEPYEKWNHHLGYGNMWHVCEEAFAANGCEPVVKTDDCWFGPLLFHAQQMCKQYPMQQDDISKWFDVCRVQFPEYVKYWAEHPDVVNRKPLMQEQVFDVPYVLPSGRSVRLRGKFDSVDLINGGIYLQENKTKGDIDKLQVERQLKFDLQTMMYLIALESDDLMRYESEGHYASDEPPYPVRGVRYNVVRRPLSGGKGTIKQLDNVRTSKHYKAKYGKDCPQRPETEGEFYERLRCDYIAADPDYWFFRIRAEISQKDIEVFRHTCLDPILETVCDWYDHITGEDKFDRFWPCVSGYKAVHHWRTPFGIWSALEEDGATEYDAYLETGSEMGLRRVETLFPELQ